MRIIAKCLSLASVPLALLLLLPSGGTTMGLPSLISGGVGLGADFFIKKKINEQRMEMAERVRSVVNQVTLNLEEKINIYIHNIYKSILHDLKMETNKNLDQLINVIKEKQKEIDDCYSETNKLEADLMNVKNEILQLIW